MSACGVLAGEITENHFHYETSDNQEDEHNRETGRKKGKGKGKKEKHIEHTCPPIIRHYYSVFN